MTLARTWAVALNGLAGQLVAVEADLAAGLPGTTVIGMGDAAVTQARDRIRAAVLNSGHKWPDRRITLALSPAALPKRGAGYDIALAIAVLAAAGVVPSVAPGQTVLIGELGLDGQVRPVRGVLPALLAARSAGRERAIVPLANLAEAALATGMAVWGVASLGELVASFKGEIDALITGFPALSVGVQPIADLADVLGQPEARLALEFAAAGGHHLAMIGPPGAGKTMLATRLPGVLPMLNDEQALEVTAVHSVAGTLDDDTPLVTRPPFVDPHHSASLAAVVGGGSAHIRPGSVSLAHRGVLFLDEAHETKYTHRVSLGIRRGLARQRFEENNIRPRCVEICRYEKGSGRTGADALAGLLSRSTSRRAKSIADDQQWRPPPQLLARRGTKCHRPSAVLRPRFKLGTLVGPVSSHGGMMAV